MYKEEFLPLNRGFDTFYGYYQGAEDYFNHTSKSNLLMIRRGLQITCLVYAFICDFVTTRSSLYESAKITNSLFCGWAPSFWLDMQLFNWCTKIILILHWFFYVVCASYNQKSYCGEDLHNQTTPDFSKQGQYSAHVFTKEAIRQIDVQVFHASALYLCAALVILFDLTLQWRLFIL